MARGTLLAMEDGSRARGRVDVAWTMASTIVGAAFLLVAIGFVDGGGDSVQYLLPAYQAIDPAFAAGDWFVHETTVYHLAFGWYTTAALRADLLTPALWLWHVVTLALLSFTALRFVQRFSVGPPRSHARVREVVALLVVLAFIAGQFGETWGDRVPAGPSALPSFMAIPLSLGLWHATLDRRVIAGGLWFAALAVVHTHAAAIAAVCALPLLLVGRAVEVLRDPRSFAGLGLAVAGLIPSVLVLLAPSSSGATADVPPGIFDVLFFGRAPHHFAPHLATWPVHVTSTFALLSTLAGVVVTTTGRTRSALLAWYVTFAAASAASVFFLVVVPFPPAVFAFPLRLLPSVLVVGACALAARATRAPEEPTTFFTAAWLVLPLSLPACGVLTAIGAGTLVASSRSPAAAAWRRVASRAALAVVVVVAGWSFARAAQKAPSLTARWPDPATGELFAALRERTEPGSVVAVPPHIIGVQIGANRAVVVDFKCTPVTRGAELQVWRLRMEALTGVDPLSFRARPHRQPLRLFRRGYDRRDARALLDDLRPYGATHVVAVAGSPLDESLKALPEARELWRSSRFGLFAARVARGE